MSTYTKSQALMSVIGAFGLLLAGSAQAAVTTNMWAKTLESGNWNTSSSWSNSKVPGTSSIVRFDSSIDVDVNCNMEIDKVAGVLKQNSGTVTLRNIKPSFKFGNLTQSNGKLLFVWNGTAPSNPLTSITVKGGSIVDLGGATQNLTSFPTFTSGKKLTLLNGTVTTEKWDRKTPFTLVIGEGTICNVTDRFRNTEAQDDGQIVNVQDGGELNLTSSDGPYIGVWYKNRKTTVNCTNRGVFNATQTNLKIGYAGTGIVTVDNATFNVGSKIIYCTRPSDNVDTSADKGLYNGIATLTLLNGSVLTADSINYGKDNEKGVGEFNLSVSGNSRLYIKQLKGSGQTVDSVTLDGAVFIPTASGVLIQGNTGCSAKSGTDATDVRAVLRDDAA